MQRLGYVLLAMVLAGCGAPAAPAAVAEPTTTAPAITVVPVATAPPPPAAPTTTPPAAPTPASTPAIPATATVVAAAPTPTPSLQQERYSTLGNPNAPITIYEFADLGCPSCRQYHLFTFPTIRERYIDTGQVYYVYKDYPIVSSQGGLAAQAAECAGEQGQYWAMHHQLFLDPAAWNASPEAAQQVFAAQATALGLDAPALLTCVSEARYQADVDGDFEEGLSIGIFGTPTFIINRKLMAGAQSAETFIEVIERELAQVGQ